MNDPIEVCELAASGRDLERFLKFSHSIYRHDPCWVAPLLMDLRSLFSPQNPFFQHAEMKLFMARQDGRDVGRIAAIQDQNHNGFHGVEETFFGFFEAVNDPSVSQALLGQVLAWSKSKGSRRLLGPISPSTNHECGLLIEGFDSSPTLMMTYNPPYYAPLIEVCEFSKAKDLLAFEIELDQHPGERLDRLCNSFRKRQKGITVRPVSKKTLEKDLHKIKQVYNSAWEANWGFVPLTDAEIDFMAERMKPLLIEGLVYIAEADGEGVAFLMSVPDFNQVLKPLRGRLLTPRVISVLPYLLGWKMPSQARVVTLGTRKEFRNRGIEAVMFAKVLQFSLQSGFKRYEASWILEDNMPVQRLVELFGGKPSKRYRIYQQDLPTFTA